MLDDPKDPFRLSPKNVFIWGSAIVALLVLLVFLFVPPAPQTLGVPQPYGAYDAERRANAGYNDPSPAEATETASVASGTGELRSAQLLYDTYCAQCHGKGGAGDAPLARMMTNKPANLITGPYKFVRTEAGIAAIVRNGVGSMPGFEEEINEAEALLLARHVLDFEASTDEIKNTDKSTTEGEYGQ